MSLIISTSSLSRAEPRPTLRLGCDLAIVPIQDGSFMLEMSSEEGNYKTQHSQQPKGGCTGLVTRIRSFCCLLFPLLPSIPGRASQSPLVWGKEYLIFLFLYLSNDTRIYSIETPPSFWVLDYIHSVVFHGGNTCLGEVCILITAKAWNELYLLGSVSTFLMENFIFCAKRISCFFASFHMTCVLFLRWYVM